MSISNEDAKKVVEDGYDQIAQEYLTWATQTTTPREGMVERMLQALECPADKAQVLELGCGAGIPTTQILSQKCQKVYANDISKSQIELAKKRFATDASSGGNVEFLHSDMMGVQLDWASVDAVVAMYSMIHVPRTELLALLHKIHMWLMPDGVLLCNLAAKEADGSVSRWLNTDMYWSSWDSEKHLKMFKTAGFEMIHTEIITENEDGNEVPFQWILARKGVPQAEDRQDD